MRSAESAPAASAPIPAPNRVNAAAEDLHRMMELLRISQPGPFPPPAEGPKRPQHLAQRPGNINNWHDAAGNTHVRSGWGNWSNYDESKANRYPIPDPLVLKNGQLVKDADTWWKQRRPEILNDFLTMKGTRGNPMLGRARRRVLGPEPRHGLF